MSRHCIVATGRGCIVRRRVLFVFVMFAIAIGSRAVAQGSDGDERLKAYLAEIPNLASRYGDLLVEGTVTERITPSATAPPQARNEKHSISEIRFYEAGAKILTQSNFTESRHNIQGKVTENALVGLERSVMCDGERYIEFFRQPSERSYTLRKRGRESDDPWRNEVESARAYVVPMLQLFGGDLDRLLRSPQLRIQRVADVAKNGGNLTRLEFEVLPGGDLGPKSGWIEVDPERGWIVTSYAFDVPSEGSNLSCAVEYAAEPRMYPPVRKTDIVLSYPKAGITDERTFTATRYEFRKPDSDVFSWSRYGFADLANPVRPMNVLPIVALVLSVLLLVLAAILWRRSRASVGAR
jgi:hypothetical protein